MSFERLGLPISLWSFIFRTWGLIVKQGLLLPKARQFCGESLHNCLLSSSSLRAGLLFQTTRSRPEKYYERKKNNSLVMNVVFHILDKENTRIMFPLDLTVAVSVAEIQASIFAFVQKFIWQFLKLTIFNEFIKIQKVCGMSITAIWYCISRFVWNSSQKHSDMHWLFILQTLSVYHVLFLYDWRLFYEIHQFWRKKDKKLIYVFHPPEDRTSVSYKKEWIIRLHIFVNESQIFLINFKLKFRWFIVTNAWLYSSFFFFLFKWNFIIFY